MRKSDTMTEQLLGWLKMRFTPLSLLQPVQVFLLLLLISVASAVTISTFSDSSTIKNITFNYSYRQDNKTVIVPRYANTTNFKINLTGYNYEGGYVTNYSLNGTGKGSGMDLGITTNGTFIWVSSWSGTGVVYKYDMNGGFIENFSTANPGNGYPYGLTNNNTFIWTWDYTTEKVYKYHMNGTYTGDNFSVSHNVVPNIASIGNNNTHLFVTDNSVLNYHKVYIHYLNGTYTGDNFTAWTGLGNVYGAYSDNSYLWLIFDGSAETYPRNDYVKKFTMTGTYLSNFTLSSNHSYDITGNGTYFWVIDFGENNSIYQYKMTSYPTDLSLDLANSGSVSEWSQTGELTTKNESSLNVTLLNNYLSTCNKDIYGNCTVNLNFTSQSAGILQLSDILLDYNETYTGNVTAYGTYPAAWSLSGAVGTLQTKNFELNNTGSFSTKYKPSCSAGAVCNTTNFTVAYTNTTISLNLNSKDTISVNVTPGASVPAGTYAGNITFTNSSDYIAITFAVSNNVGYPQVYNNAWSLNVYSTETSTKQLSVNMTGNYNLTGCNFSVTQASSCTSWNSNNFNLSSTDSTRTVTMYFTSCPTGLYNPTLELECQSSATGLNSNYTSFILWSQLSQTTGGGSSQEPYTEEELEELIKRLANQTLANQTITLPPILQESNVVRIEVAFIMLSVLGLVWYEYSKSRKSDRRWS